MLIPATNCKEWRALLAKIGEVDSSYLPEYHLAYALRIPGSEPLLFHHEEAGEHFLYPFLLTPVVINSKATGYYDISSIYGYTGPIATTHASDFLNAAWSAFDAYANEKKIIAEFVRFSPFNHTEKFAHPFTKVEANRTLAASNLPKTEEELLAALGSKTRNMIRKAEKEGLDARALPLPEYLTTFRHLYAETMARNAAPEFFHYDDAYWQHMLKLGEGLRLFGVFHHEKLVATAMTVMHGKSALYHLGASEPSAAKLGAGNLCLYEMSRSLMEEGVTFLNMTGGRSTAADDPLLLFKKSNATGTATFYIGKRIINGAAYGDVIEKWSANGGAPPDAAKIIFWRS